MNNLGIIVEYNPFHNGHIYHINKSKQETNSQNVIAVMSGNFVQRGEPSIFNKYTRTKLALQNGVDIVLELPTVYATSSAELFSHSAVSILDKSNIVNTICFGSESGSIKPIQSVANILTNESSHFKMLLKEELSTGVNFPKARQNALSKISPSLSDVVSSPNNILGIEYLKSLNKLNSKIKPYTILRKSSDYNDTSLPNSFSSIASATSIRQSLLASKSNNINDISAFVPKNTFEQLEYTLNNDLLPYLDTAFSILKYKIITSDVSTLTNILDMSDGLSSRLLKVLPLCTSYTDLINNLQSKRYTNTRIKRALLHLLLNIKVSDIELYSTINYIPYIRVLGFRKDKSYLLSNLINSSSVPVITNIKNANLCTIGNKMLEDEFMYTNIYNQLLTNSPKKTYNKTILSELNFEQKQPLVII